MNCVKGDLAIIVKSTCGNEGKIVKCLALVPAGYDGLPESPGPRWIVDAFLMASDGHVDQGKVPDSWLRPLRENPEADETLKWAGKPREEVKSIYCSTDPEEFRRFKDEFEKQFGLLR
jgi:hypothetical protein